MNELLTLMNERKELYKEFLRLGNDMPTLSIDDLTVRDEERQKVKNRISSLESTIKQTYENDKDVDIINRVIGCRLDYDEVDDSYRALFEVSQETFALIYRCIELENYIKTHYEQLIDELADDLKEANKNLKVTNKYASIMNDEVDVNNRRSA